MANNNNIYLVGIKGVGMTSLATYLKQRGKNVWGSDVSEVFPTDRILQKAGITVLAGFEPKNITDDIDLVITTGAHGGLQNIEVQTARDQKIPVMTQAEEVGHIMAAYKTSISVCGTHGKTTTSSMVAYVLRQLRLSSSHIVGAPDFSGMLGGEYAGLDYFVAEADEYVNSPGIDNTARFMFQHPTHLICTNIEHDHPDIYPSLASIETTFGAFFQQCNQDGGLIVYNGDEKNLTNIAQKYPRGVSFGFSPGLDLVLSQPVQHDESHFYASYKGQDLGEFTLAIPGMHNIINAGAVITFCAVNCLKMEHVKEALSQFTGARRRFEKIFELKGIYLFDDYAHHPTELKALLEAAKLRFPQQKIILIFQPHTHSRTSRFFNEFVNSLALSNQTFILDIFGSAREKENDDVSSKQLAIEAVRKGMSNVQYLAQEDF